MSVDIWLLSSQRIQYRPGARGGRRAAAPEFYCGGWDAPSSSLSTCERHGAALHQAHRSTPRHCSDSIRAASGTTGLANNGRMQLLLNRMHWPCLGRSPASGCPACSTSGRRSAVAIFASLWRGCSGVSGSGERCDGALGPDTPDTTARHTGGLGAGVRTVVLGTPAVEYLAMATECPAIANLFRARGARTRDRVALLPAVVRRGVRDDRARPSEQAREWDSPKVSRAGQAA